MCLFFAGLSAVVESSCSTPRGRSCGGNRIVDLGVRKGLFASCCSIFRYELSVLLPLFQSGVVWFVAVVPPLGTTSSAIRGFVPGFLSFDCLALLREGSAIV